MKKITIGAVSPVIFKDKFLLIKRIKPPYAGFWSLVGGKIKFGEHINETVVREVLEETGLKVKFVSVRGMVVEHLKTKNETTEHIVLWVCETRASHSKAIEQNEGKVKWFTKEELKKNKNDLIPSDYKMIETFFLKNKKKLLIHKSHIVSKGKSYELEYFGI